MLCDLRHSPDREVEGGGVTKMHSEKEHLLGYGIEWRAKG